MSLRAAFLRDVVESYDDDAPRLVYADWLEENGDPQRAEFIRVQCALAPLEDYDPPRWDLAAREADLLAANRRRWLAELPEVLITVGDYLPRFERGFPAEVELRASAFVKRGAELVAAGCAGFELADVGKARVQTCPHLAGVRRLDLPAALPPARVEAILSSPHLTELRELDLGRSADVRLVAAWPGAASLRKLSLSDGVVAPDEIKALARCEFLGGLSCLRLHGGAFDRGGANAIARSATLTGLRELEFRAACGATGFAALASSANLARLEKLWLNSARTGDAALAAFATSPHLARLRSLVLPSCRVGPEGLRRLAASDNFRELRHLNLSYNSPGAEGLRALASSPRLASLCSLNLNKCGLDDAALAALAGSPHLRLRYLELYEDPVGPAGMLALARSAVLSEIEHLEISFCRVGDEPMAALASSPAARSLRKLDLLECGVGDAGARAVADAGWPRLLELTLAANPITDAGGAALAGSPMLASVRELSLGSTQVSDETVLALARSPHVRNLRDLSIGHSRVTDVGARALAESPNLPNLRRLIVWSNQLTRAGHEALWARFGDNVYPQRRQLDQDAD
jgi:uncharacterized protein (TIGR02996 family)